MLKFLLSSVLLFGLSVQAYAQVIAKADTTSMSSGSGGVQSASKPRLKAKALARLLPEPEATLTPAELDIAQRVQLGKLPCELGASVSLAADPKAPGYFNVQIRQLKFRMSPVETSTGAIRLEDRKAGAVWLQLANKSMLMNQKLGQRLADACMNPDQIVVAQQMEQNPTPSVLDAPAEAEPK
jgi:hypothetical protein